jgi:Endosomal/lysosomal potassium channel TMEM175
VHAADHEHIVRRLESFSDIVIAFGLAEIAFNLVIPPHAALFVTHPIGIVAFIVTFGVVAAFWSTHTVIFRNYFVANKIMIFLNFVALAAIVLQVFALQLWLHFRDNVTDNIDAGRIYFGIFSITFGTLSVLWAAGTFYRWPELTPALRRAGIKRSIQIACTVIGTAIGVGLGSSALGNVSFKVGVDGNVDQIASAPAQIFLGYFAGLAIGRVIGFFVTRAPARKAV